MAPTNEYGVCIRSCWRRRDTHCILSKLPVPKRICSLLDGKADVALVQAGTATDEQAEKLSSLGSLFYEPLWIFYRMESGDTKLHRVTDLHGQSIAIGEEDGGTYDIAKFIAGRERHHQ